MKEKKGKNACMPWSVLMLRACILEDAYLYAGTRTLRSSNDGPVEQCSKSYATQKKRKGWMDMTNEFEPNSGVLHKGTRGRYDVD